MCPMLDGPKPHIGGPVVVGEPTVLIGYMPAARIGDTAICVGPPDQIAQGSPTVLIGNKPASRIGDMTVHGGVIVKGEPTVLIGIPGQGSVLQSAARSGTPFVSQCPETEPPEPVQEETMKNAAEDGKAFCEECSK